MAMASNYKRYLAERVLGEHEHVTYRALSRALKVHCNHAKRMLYEFHRHENSKKPNSVYATYIVIGVPEPEARSNGHLRDDDDDENLQNSFSMSSQLVPGDSDKESIPVTEVRLVREEELSAVKSQFKSISSIFVYSVQSTSPQDLNVLADLGYAIHESELEDPLTHGPRYGMIQNKNVKRRTGIAPPPVTRPSPETAKHKAAKPAVLPQPVNQEETAQNELTEKQERPKAEAESTSRPPSQQSARSLGQSKAAEKPPQKRANSSIFKAFAKAKPKLKQEESSESSAVEAQKPEEPEDVVMGDDSEGEEQEDLFLDSGIRKSTQPRETRKEREERLRKMMEEDEDMPDAPDEPAAPEEPVVSEDPVEREEPSAEEKQTAMETTESSSGNRRRRGRRQVMKKKVMRDAEGYLVTKEEPVWESFSEDEPEPPRRKPPVSVAKPGKGPAKGQGSIMSFFKKQ
ncbi:hypothetical protein VTO42DRAFT_3075 [Malbranchea cinnamomea]